MLERRAPSPGSSSGEGLTDAQKLNLVVRNCVQKTVELVLHALRLLRRVLPGRVGHLRLRRRDRAVHGLM